MPKKVPLTSDDSNITRELDIGNLIREIDPLQRYFLPLSGDSCELEPDASGIIRRGYFLTYGGRTLSDFRGYLTSDKLTSWLRRLLEAITILQDHNLVHGDLHTSNIVSYSLRDLPRIIDFDTTKIVESNVDDRVRYYDTKTLGVALQMYLLPEIVDDAWTLRTVVNKMVKESLSAREYSTMLR